ncbi:MAG: hypothetical protein ABFC28_06170 [Rikenellaceae bacterium]
MLIINRRYIFIVLPIVLLLLGGGVAFFLINRKKTAEEIDKRGVVLKNAIAIPVDAVAIFSFRNISVLKKSFMDTSSLFSRFIKDDNELMKLLGSIDKISYDMLSLKELSNSEMSFSVHYSAKNDLSLLFCTDLSDKSIDKEMLLKCILKAYPKCTKRGFNGVDIFISKGVLFSIYKDQLIASTSPIVLESSIRHLLSKTSILDNHDFAKVLKKSVKEDNILLINHQNIGKIFSSIMDRKFWGYSDFFSKFSSWTTLNGEFNPTCQSYKGEFLNMKGVGNYSEVFKNNEGGELKAWKILPYNTFAMLTFPLKDFKNFFSVYREYKELYKKLNSLSLEEHQSWFLSLNPQELSIALIPYGGTLRWVTLIKANIKKEAKDGQVEIFRHKGAIADLFGELFSYTEEKFYCKTGGWIIIGGKDIIEEFANGSFSNFTMDEYFSQSDVYNKILKDNMFLSLIVNVSSQPDSLAIIFKKSMKEEVSKRLTDKNFEVLTYQLTQSESGVKMDILLYADRMKKLPVSKRVGVNKPTNWELDTIVQVPSGPFRLLNFNNGEAEYLEQLPNYKLRLLDKDKKGVWTVPFSTPLRGYVAQVDYFGNKKLQMLFASGNELYLLDRLGRFTGTFPKRVNSLIMLGPKTYDIKGDGNFAIMLLHTDNSLRLYDRECNNYPAWNNIKTAETIKDFPELIKVGKNKYWVLRTQLQTIIFTINGNPVTTFSDRNILMPATELKIISDSEVMVTTKAGTDVILNLENGKIKRLKK